MSTKIAPDTLFCIVAGILHTGIGANLNTFPGGIMKVFLLFFSFMTLNVTSAQERISVSEQEVEQILSANKGYRFQHLCHLDRPEKSDCDVGQKLREAMTDDLKKRVAQVIESEKTQLEDLIEFYSLLNKEGDWKKVREKFPEQSQTASAELGKIAKRITELKEADILAKKAANSIHHPKLRQGFGCSTRLPGGAVIAGDGSLNILVVAMKLEATCGVK